MTQDASTQKALDPATFGSVMGQAVWLMTMDRRYRDRKISDIEDIVSAPLLLRQFKLYSKDKQPVAFLTWASVSDEIRARIDAGDRVLKLEEWRSGPHVVVVDCVSPFQSASVFTEKFSEHVREVTAHAEKDL